MQWLWGCAVFAVAWEVEEGIVQWLGGCLAVDAWGGQRWRGVCMQGHGGYSGDGLASRRQPHHRRGGGKYIGGLHA